MLMNKIATLSLAAALAAVTGPSFAQDADSAARDSFYCDERKLGSWFYCNSEKVKREKREREQPSPQAVPAVERMEAITRQLDELKAKAILEPTTENITSYIRFQRQQLDRASTFADVWSRAIWQNPELDYTLDRPVSTVAKQSWQESRTGHRDQSMEALTQRYGVFYFYSASCGACQAFSPVMRSLSDRFGLEVLAVSMDGGGNHFFPNYAVDNGQYEAMGLQGRTVPALVLFDTHTKTPIPIGYGVMAADEVMQRIVYLTQIEPGSDF